MSKLVGIVWICVLLHKYWIPFIVTQGCSACFWETPFQDTSADVVVAIELGMFSLVGKIFIWVVCDRKNKCPLFRKAVVIGCFLGNPAFRYFINSGGCHRVRQVQFSRKTWGEICCRCQKKKTMGRYRNGVVVCGLFRNIISRHFRKSCDYHRFGHVHIECKALHYLYLSTKKEEGFYRNAVVAGECPGHAL